MSRSKGFLNCSPTSTALASMPLLAARAPYLEWAENLSSNDIVGRQHRLIRAGLSSVAIDGAGDVRVIFIDLPTFSNSNRTRGLCLQPLNSSLLADKPC
ncbi:MAG: Ribosomal RNA large subunit methyltransferase K/L [Sodalis sp.]|nr:MAG: Ribosomal RNA large subunit methyltransferase K/L [Sodalis sp.]